MSTPTGSSVCSRPRDYRDLAVEDAVTDLVRMEAAYVAALRDAEAYRLLAQRAIRALADQHAERAQLEQRYHQLLEEHHRLVDQYRHLRKQMMRDSEVAA